MKQVPTTWDETRFIDGYPGKYAVVARRHGKQWYVAAVNGTKEVLKLKFAVSFQLQSLQLGLQFFIIIIE